MGLMDIFCCGFKTNLGDAPAIEEEGRVRPTTYPAYDPYSAAPYSPTQGSHGMQSPNLHPYSPNLTQGSMHNPNRYSQAPSGSPYANQGTEMQSPYLGSQDGQRYSKYSTGTGTEMQSPYLGTQDGRYSKQSSAPEYQYNLHQNPQLAGAYSPGMQGYGSPGVGGDSTERERLEAWRRDVKAGEEDAKLDVARPPATLSEMPG